MRSSTWVGHHLTGFAAKYKMRLPTANQQYPVKRCFFYGG